MIYLKSLSHCFQKIGHQGVVPEVCEPHSGAINIHRTREEKAGTWEVKLCIEREELGSIGSILKIILTELKKEHWSKLKHREY